MLESLGGLKAYLQLQVRPALGRIGSLIAPAALCEERLARIAQTQPSSQSMVADMQQGAR